ncbi:MAG: Txe/YoeB family addiction module toxin [Gloeocapsa sp. UFS-A4-WI-NPMV-4B04]|nr:Txe/YoeB family addiction module toxin [Gloeocapsa sp. UFS-A4-WI-NPMV-4B04]
MQIEVQQIGRVLVFEPEFREDLGWWYKNEPQKAFKILDIVQDVLRTPFKGIGKPEPLNYLNSDTLSRRIDLEHRVIYRVTRDRIDFLQARYHYE